MGLHTTYVGHVVIEPPLSNEEMDFVRRFGHTRHYDSGEPGVRLALHPADDDSGAASIPRRPGVDEYGYGPAVQEGRERRAELAARRRRYDAALEQDRAAAG